MKNLAVIKVTNDKKVDFWEIYKNINEINKVYLFECHKEEDFAKIENIVSISTRLLSNIPEEYENLAKIEEEEKELEKTGIILLFFIFITFFWIEKNKKDKKKKHNKKRG